jgi:hypothetical protein
MPAKYGYVAEVPGPGRQKPWRMASTNQSWSRQGVDDETALAADAATEAFLDAEFAKIKERYRGSQLEPDEWREKLGVNGYTEFLTPEELGDVLAEVNAIFARTAARRENPASRPEGSRPVRIFLSTSVPPKTT